MAPAKVQAPRVVTIQRSKLVAERTRLSNRINSDLLRFGHTIGQLGPVTGKLVRPLIEDFCRNGRVALHPEYFSDRILPPLVIRAFEQRWQRIDQIGTEVDELEASALGHIKGTTWPIEGGRLVTGGELLKRLESVPGVGTWTACVWLAEVGDITRFAHAKKLCAYAGLDPSLGTSAGQVVSRLARKGNGRLQNALRNAARAALASTRATSFTGWVRGYIGRHVSVSKSKALKAMARRLCKALYYVHSRCEPFDDRKYRPLLSESSYPQCTVQEMGFSPRVTRALEESGLLTSKRVVEAFYSDLARRPGCGATTVQRVADWIDRQRGPEPDRRATTKPLEERP
jgi:transposase